MVDCIFGDAYTLHSIFTLANIEVIPKEDYFLRSNREYFHDFLK